MVSREDIEYYQQNGVVKLQSVFDQDWIERLRVATEQALANPGPYAEEYAKGDGRFFGDLDVAKRNSIFHDFIFNSSAAELMSVIMESSKVNFFYDQLLVKEPGTEERTPWHQDQPYWAVSGRQVASIWLPLDPVSKESSVQYIAGSHRWEEHNPHNFLDDTPYEGTGLKELPDIDANLRAYDILAWDMAPGDCLVFQAMMVHGSSGNLSTSARRRAWATRWTGDDARFAERPGKVAIPTFDCGLKHGDKLDSEHFPVIWKSS